MAPYLKNPTFREAPDKLAERRATFDDLNNIAVANDGWLVSVPGSRDVVVETLVGSQLPHILADRGHDLEREPAGERILPDGRIVPTRKWSFRIP